MVFLSDEDSYIGDFYDVTDNFNLKNDKSTLGFEQGGFLLPNYAFSHKFEDGGYTDDQPISYSTWKTWQEM
jgi:hypothetical protein